MSWDEAAHGGSGSWSPTASQKPFLTGKKKTLNLSWILLQLVVVWSIVSVYQTCQTF